jgi:hypothetical protein
MKLTLTIRELSNYNWDKVCAVTGLNPWCMAEGLASGDEAVELTEEQAREIGVMSKREE